MYQLPVNNLTRIRRARKQVKRALEDIGLEYCKEAAEEFKEFCPDEQFVKASLCLDICTWDPSFSKTQEYRSKPFCCTECPFSSKYYSGYKNHFRNVHRKIFESKILLNCPYCTFTASKRILETHVKIFHIPSSARQKYGNPQGAALAKKDKLFLDRVKPGDSMEKAMYFCKKCSFRDSLYNVVRRHIYREHFRHIVSPYFAMVPESSVKNGANPVNGNNILCKRCQFSTRSYEALVQHVVEYHERIGAQVTTMIGHANIIVSRPQPLPVASQKAPLVLRGQKVRTDQTAQNVIGYLKPVAPPAKKQSSITASQIRATVSSNSSAADSNAAGVNTAQTQKWKICTVCNELFPENLYNAHFESAHKAKRIWALAKYIMKIHNFTSKCLLCNRYLPSDTLLNHMLIHGLTCPQCHSAFHNVEKIIEHVAQSHPDDFVGPPGASPLTFDLTLKQDKASNVQLVVLTFNMKESINGKDQSALAQNSGPPQGKFTNPRIIEKKSDQFPRSFSVLPYKSEVGKTLCPLCFTIIKGPISDSLAMHLRERHQVLQTMHPVEKKMTYKCIHCLGVYTSNMVASTITLHLVQCRAVGRNQAGQGFKSALTLNSSGAGFLKRQPPTQAMSNPKKMKLSKESKVSSTTVGNPSDGLALDPRSYEHKTYEARKEFLTSYFNRRPYLSSQEEEKLSASLWLWKSDIASHFANKRRMCERQCQTKKLSVLLGFDMYALNKVKHDLLFVESTLDATSTGRSGGLKSGTPSTGQNKQGETLNCTLKLNTCAETISIDSDSEPETENGPTENGPTENRPAENGSVDTNQDENVTSEEAANLNEETEPLITAESSTENENALQDGNVNALTTSC
ncbi:activity-dependent neuroprotector homeobox a [Cyclopterus lumpus]|uniref:activity-dependent neuroprotector homeobox a n=1 Tax=Cyclopterus lumpus TaxID=8103 RepID=UPI001486DB27|nr:activity-dependent neuroprotector homeobox a [Cyclopterus lumpus]